MKEKFEDRRLKGSISVTLKQRDMVWKADKADLCQKIKTVTTEYQRQGYKLTLRQLYYQLVSREWIINHDIVYKKISSILDDLRYSGELDWESIEDIESCGGDEFEEGFLLKNFGEDWRENGLLIYVMCRFKVKHVGLTMAQIEEYKPPPNPAKITDPRAAKYIEKYGEVSWEVDALKPNILEAILEVDIEEEIDMVTYKRWCEREDEDKEKITKIIEGLKEENDEDEENEE